MMPGFPDLGPHAGFIWAAYAVTLAAVAALTVFIVGNDRHQKRLLAELEKRGITRRSAKTTTTTSEKKPAAKAAAKPKAPTGAKSQTAAKRKPASKPRTRRSSKRQTAT